jgi:hypothetical protein
MNKSADDIILDVSIAVSFSVVTTLGHLTTDVKEIWEVGRLDLLKTREKLVKIPTGVSEQMNKKQPNTILDSDRE